MLRKKSAYSYKKQLTFFIKQQILKVPNLKWELFEIVKGYVNHENTQTLCGKKSKSEDGRDRANKKAA